jgi:mono/diheme cytochrome c family protein
MGNGTDPTKRAEYMPAFDTTLLTDADLALIETYLGSM